MTTPQPQLQAWHDSTATVRHGDLTGMIHARQMAEIRAAEEAAAKEAKAEQDAADEAAAADDPDKVLDLCDARRAWDEQNGIVS